MSYFQSESVVVSLNQEEITSILEKFLIDKFYHIKYNKFDLKSVIFDSPGDRSDEVRCEMIFEKVIKQVDNVLEDSNG